MAIFGDSDYDEPVCKSDSQAEPLVQTMQARVLRRALAALAVGSLLLTPALAQAVTHGKRPVPVVSPAVSPEAGSSAGAGATKVSPYTIANRKHAEMSRAEHASAPGVPVGFQHMQFGPGRGR
jgi:hypothetical protein